MAAANTKKLPFPQEEEFFTVRLDVEQAEKGTAKKGNPGQDPQSRSTELQEFLDFDPSKTAGEEGRCSMRGNENAVVLTNEHGHSHIMGINTELLTNADSQRQQTKEVGVRTEHHADRHSKDTEDILQVTAQCRRNENDEHFGHFLHHTGLGQNAQEDTRKQEGSSAWSVPWQRAF